MIHLTTAILTIIFGVGFTWTGCIRACEDGEKMGLVQIVVGLGILACGVVGVCQ